MASCNLRPSSGISYAPVIIRYGCGAPAPSTFLPEEPSMIIEDSEEKKTHNFTNNQNSLFTTAGDRLPPVDVSDYTYLFLFISLMYYSVVQWMSRWGGDLVICMSCNTIAICTLCIDFRIRDGFKCPPCFKTQHNQVPYVCF